MSQSTNVREKSAEAYRTIGEVAEALKLPQHVLRFWETRFPQIKPLKRGGNRRYYRPEDVELLSAIRHLLYGEGYTIKGVQRLLRERGPRAVAGLTPGHGVATLPMAIQAAGAFGDSSPMIDIVHRGGGSDMPGEGAGGRAAADEGLAFLNFGGGKRLPAPDGAMGEPKDHLRMILAELADCRRILDAARA